MIPKKILKIIDQEDWEGTIELSDAPGVAIKFCSQGKLPCEAFFIDTTRIVVKLRKGKASEGFIGAAKLLESLGAHSQVWWLNNLDSAEPLEPPGKPLALSYENIKGVEELIIIKGEWFVEFSPGNRIIDWGNGKIVRGEQMEKLYIENKDGKEVSIEILDEKIQEQKEKNERRKRTHDGKRRKRAASRDKSPGGRTPEHESGESSGVVQQEPN